VPDRTMYSPFSKGFDDPAACKLLERETTCAVFAQTAMGTLIDNGVTDFVIFELVFPM